jgi:hypothetical protein
MSISNKLSTSGGHLKDGMSLLSSGWNLTVYKSNVHFFCAILLILVVLPGICNGEETKTVWPSVLVITTSSDKSPDAQIEKIIEESVVLELQRNNLPVALTQRSDELSQTNTQEFPIKIDSFLYDIAASAEADFVVVCIYSRLADRIRIDFRWHAVQSKTLETELWREARIDLALDTTIRKAIVEIVDRNREKIQNLVRTVVVEEAAETDAPLLPAREQVRLEEAEEKRIEISVGISPFITTGDASEYFKSGLMPILSGSYRIPFAAGTIGIGLVAGYNIFEAAGTGSASQNSLLPVGLDVKYWIGGGIPVGLFIRLAGGPAVFMVDVETLGSFTKLLFFATAGIGFGIPFSQSFGINLEASYMIFFDSPIAITGFTPLAYLYVRF